MTEDFDPCFRMSTHVRALDQGAFFALLFNKACTVGSLLEKAGRCMCPLNGQVQVLVSLDA